MPTILNNCVNYKSLIVYQNAVIIYDLTYFFKEHFLLRGDRTQDQMEQAARSGKQNIVEGLTDGVTSMEMSIKLLNVARGSLMELLEDYEDYLRVHNLRLWPVGDERHTKMRDYTYRHKRAEDYSRYYDRWDDETLCNLAITLIHQTDRGLYAYIKKIEQTFLEQGGIKERMSSARREARGY